MLAETEYVDKQLHYSLDYVHDILQDMETFYRQFIIITNR